MHDHASQKPLVRQLHLVIEEVAGETVVYNKLDNRLHSLNQSASFVWKHCDGKHTIADIVLGFETEYRVEDGEAAVWTAIEQFESGGLLQTAIMNPPMLGEWSRRDILKRASLGALALPLVTTMIAPVPAQSQSPNGPTGPTGPTGATGATGFAGQSKVKATGDTPGATGPTGR